MHNDERLFNEYGGKLNHELMLGFYGDHTARYAVDEVREIKRFKNKFKREHGREVQEISIFHFICIIHDIFIKACY